MWDSSGSVGTLSKGGVEDPAVHDTSLRGVVCCVPVEGLRECELIDASMYWVLKAPSGTKTKRKVSCGVARIVGVLWCSDCSSCSFFLILGRASKRPHIYLSKRKQGRSYEAEAMKPKL